MNIRMLLFALVLLVFSPLAFADEMGTGNNADSSSSSGSSSDQRTTTQPPGDEPSCSETDRDAFWQMLVDWFG